VVRVSDVVTFLDTTAPVDLAEKWDNVGLLIGRDNVQVHAIMTCLTITPDVAAEAIEREAQLIVTHHPVLFRPVQRMTTETIEGRMLLDLIAAGISVYSPHTGYDSAHEGINQQLAEALELTGVNVLRPLKAAELESLAASEVPVDGAGRYGILPAPMCLGDFCHLVKARLGIEHLQYVGETSMAIRSVGIACGAAAEFLRDAIQVGCQALLTGEARFHDCLEARSKDFALILPGHYATERPAIEHLAQSLLAPRFPDLTIWASHNESDPIQWN
jgi:dinuclear metal center YbgI/SA1388 family protein